MFVWKFKNISKLIITFTYFISLSAQSKVSGNELPERTRVLQTETWHLIMNRLVEVQPKKVGFEKFIKAIAQNPDAKELLPIIAEGKKAKFLPEVSIDGEELVIAESASQTIRIQYLADGSGAYLINGKNFHPDTQKPILNQVQEFLKTVPAKKIKQVRSLNPFINEAFADEETQQLLRAGFTGTLLTGTAIGFGLAAFSATSLSRVGLLVVGGYLALGSIYCLGSDEKFLNCLSTPLSFIGMNPQDRMYVKDIKCNSTGPQVFVSSAMGRNETREFVEEGGKLKKIVISSSDGKISSEATTSLNLSTNENKVEAGLIQYNNGKATSKLIRPDHQKILDEAGLLIENYKIYKDLCQHPDRLKALLKNIPSGADKLKAAEDATRAEHVKGIQ